MQRIISEEEYIIERDANPRALHFPEIKKQQIIYENSDFILVANKFPYLEYDNEKVIKHYLIVSRRNEIEQFEELENYEFVSLKDVCRVIENNFSGKYDIVYMRKLNRKSIQKFHTHVLFFEKKYN